MRARSRTLWLAASGLALAASATWQPTGSARADEPGKGESGGLPKCIEVSPQTLPRSYGYDHIVEIKNGCDKPAVCAVKTQAITHPVERTVPAGQTERILMQRGAPSGAFVPDVTCKLASS